MAASVPEPSEVIGRKNCWTCQYAVIETTTDGKVKAWACKAFMHFHEGVTYDIGEWLSRNGSPGDYETPCSPTATKCPEWEKA